MNGFLKLIATGVISASTIVTVLPASANYGDFGQEVYLAQKQMRLVPQGVPGIVIGRAVDQSKLVKDQIGSQADKAISRQEKR